MSRSKRNRPIVLRPANTEDEPKPNETAYPIPMAQAELLANAQREHEALLQAAQKAVDESQTRLNGLFTIALAGVGVTESKRVLRIMATPDGAQIVVAG